MKVKSLALIIGILAASTTVQAANKNVCDDLIEAGSSQEQIKKCQDKFGVSDYAKEQSETTVAKQEADNTKKQNEEINQANIEAKKFTEKELFDAGFGQPFFAFMINYKWRPPKEKRLTTGEAMCKYLGYEKSIKSIVSSDILPKDAYKKGLTIDTNFLGIVDKEPEIWDDSDITYVVRKYVEVTCIKRKDKSISASDEIMKKMVENILILPPSINNGNGKAPASEVNDGSRNKKDGTAPNGYQKPDWMKDDADTIKK